MQSALYVSLSAQRVLQTQLETVAHNVANANTAGFRAGAVNFEALVSRTGETPVHFASEADFHVSSAQGTLKQTGNPLDVAVSGDAWFAVSTPAGMAYTRDGRMEISELGDLRSLTGYEFLDATGGPILVNPNGSSPVIHPDGRVEQDGRQIGNLGLFRIDPATMSERYDNSAVLTSAPGIAVAGGGENKIMQGFVESSNVDPAAEMVNLIAVTRAFESASATISRAEDALSNSIREIGGA